jgi:hypothetical protein
VVKSRPESIATRELFVAIKIKVPIRAAHLKIKSPDSITGTIIAIITDPDK